MASRSDKSQNCGKQILCFDCSGQNISTIHVFIMIWQDVTHSYGSGILTVRELETHIQAAGKLTSSLIRTPEIINSTRDDFQSEIQVWSYFYIICTYIYTYMHTYMRTYIHTCMYIRTIRKSSSTGRYTSYSIHKKYSSELSFAVFATWSR